MRLSSLGISVAALGLVVFIGTGPAWSQTTTESETTTTSAPVEPSVMSKTVTRKTVTNPPVVVTPPPVTSETTTTTSSDPEASVERKSRSETTYGPLGVSHSETSQKTTSY